jgi:hypothetical protein
VFSHIYVVCLHNRVMGETLKGFKPIYGTTKGQSEEAAFQELYPFLFCLQANDDSHLQIFITDFHSSTWMVEKSMGELGELVKNFVILSQI